VTLGAQCCEGGLETGIEVAGLFVEGEVDDRGERACSGVLLARRRVVGGHGFEFFPEGPGLLEGDQPGGMGAGEAFRVRWRKRAGHTPA
jgi:hypothetical protein